MELTRVLNELIEQNQAENFGVCVGKNDEILAEVYISKSADINEFTKFDMASVTKVLSTTLISLIALDKNIISLEDKVSKFFDCPADKEKLTVKHLLTHTMGIGHKNLLNNYNNYSNIQDYILNIPCDIPVGSNVEYSCPAFILMGKILEKVYSKPLNSLFDELVAIPLGLKYTSFLPNEGPFVNSNIEPEKAGIVNDYNCQFLGGIAGNAGVFSNMHDMKLIAFEILNYLEKLISRKTFETAVNNHTPNMKESRGLGFFIVDENYTQTGKLFKTGAIGHCGHTGQSIFIDLENGLFVIILSDMTVTNEKNLGHDNYETVMKNREIIHNSILELL